MKLRTKIRHGTVAAVAGAILAVGAPPAAAGEAHYKLYARDGGSSATVHKYWSKSGNTYKVRYEGQVYDRKGDGHHARIIRWADGQPLELARATHGRSASFGSPQIYANHVSFQACTYEQNTLLSCSSKK